jgi:protein-L-isoaspartate(D-aspartate) O-methyltransferase
VTCAPEHVPQPLVDQLKEGGRMMIPVGAAGVQELRLPEKREGKAQTRAVLPVRFLPMTGGGRKRAR